MLVLTRKQQQQIQIGEGVTITILKVKGNTVRIGIDAPSDVKVVRSELEPEEKPTPVQKSDTPATPSQIDQVAAPSRQRGEQSKEGYQVLSFRVDKQTGERIKAAAPDGKRNQSPRAVSMREFLASRSANAVG